VTLPANIRVNVKANFPAIVTATGIITISKANGVWTIGASFIQLQTLPTILITGNILIPVQDPATGFFYSASASALVSALAPQSRIVTVGATIAALASDGDILVDLATPSAVTVNLPSSALATRPITVKDLAGNASTDNITIVPSGSEKIDGQNNLLIASDGGSFTLYPLPAPSLGWFLR
jgi:hypothetical protein